MRVHGDVFYSRKWLKTQGNSSLRLALVSCLVCGVSLMNRERW